MGFFDFFKSGGSLGEMVTVVGKSYLILDKQDIYLLEKFVGVVTVRYLVSARSPKSVTQARDILEKFKVLALHDAKIGLGDVCMFIAEAEMDIASIEDYVGDVILKNLRHLGISDDVIYGDFFQPVDILFQMQKLGFK